MSPATPVSARRSPRPARTWRSSRYSHALKAVAPDITGPPGSDQVDVVVVERLAVDAVARRGNPCRDLAPFVHRLHQRSHICLVDIGRQPLTAAALPFLRGQLLPFG